MTTSAGIGVAARAMSLLLLRQAKKAGPDLGISWDRDEEAKEKLQWLIR